MKNVNYIEQGFSNTVTLVPQPHCAQGLKYHKVPQKHTFLIGFIVNTLKVPIDFYRVPHMAPIEEACHKGIIDENNFESVSWCA